MLIQLYRVINLQIDLIEMGERVARRRHVLNMTQDNVAEVAGISNNHVSTIERGRNIPSLETLLKLCVALKTTPDYILLGVTRQDNDSLIERIDAKLPLCDKRMLSLVDKFLSCVIEENQG